MVKCKAPETTTTTETIILQDPTKKLGDLIDVIVGGAMPGHVIMFDGTRWISVPQSAHPAIFTGNTDPFVTTDRWLAIQGIPTNVTPFLLPRPSCLTTIAFSTKGVHTWDIEIHTNTVVRTGGIPITPPAVDFMVSGLNKGFKATAIEFPAGTEIGVFARGSGITQPIVTLYFTEIT